MINATLQKDCSLLLSQLKPALENTREIVQKLEWIHTRATAINRSAAEAYDLTTIDASTYLRSVGALLNELEGLKNEFEMCSGGMIADDDEHSHGRGGVGAARSAPSKEPRQSSSKKRKQVSKHRVSGTVVKKKSPRVKDTHSVKRRGGATASSEKNGDDEAASAPVSKVVNLDSVMESGSWENSDDGDDDSTLPSVFEKDIWERNRTRSPVRPMTYQTKEEYFGTLSAEDKERLDKEADLMRKDPTRGTSDGDVIVHINMSDGPNLYFVCYKLAKMEEESIQLVEADSYDRWGRIDGVRSKMDVSEGEWWCTVLQLYYEDVLFPMESGRWRYQTHEQTGKGGMSKGYYSFQDRFRRGNSATDKDLLDWSEQLSLLTTGSFLFGPFNWQDHSEFRISPDVWNRALPLILQKRTRGGTLFWQGFSDCMLLRAGCTQEQIDDCKKRKSMMEDCPPLPVFFSEIHADRQRTMPRVSRSKDERRRICPKVWRTTEVSKTGRPNDGVKVGAWMELQAKSRKRST